MSIKNLFGKSFKNYDSASVDVESTDFVDSTIKDKETYLPPIDFATASNFVKYGSAKLYYEKSIERIYGDYPYDGSKKEQTEFQLSSSYLDRWMYETKYPKTTGYVTLGTTGYQGGKDAAGYGKTTSPEFIRVWGGIHTASTGMEGTPLRETFHKSGKYDPNLNRTQNWSIDPASGSTVEFWLKIPNFDSTKTDYMVIMDIWNGVDPYSFSNSYSRFQIRVHRNNPNEYLFQLVYFNDAAGFNFFNISNKLTDADLADWHHYAFTIQPVSNTGTAYETIFYIDGQVNANSEPSGGPAVQTSFQGLLTGYIGALQTTNVDGSSNVSSRGSGKLSGSLDEFRFWKKARTARQIELNWFTSIGGGSNTDVNNTDLGVYFKFNEGILNNLTDQTILDYSGRLANGYWQGYSSAAKSTGSAFNESSHDLVESPDPIIYSDHPEVAALYAEMSLSGSEYDGEYGGSFYESMPNWMTMEDGETQQNLKKLTQILSSYFDTLHAQISAVPNLRNKVYVEDDYKPIPFAHRLLENKGFITKDILINAEIYERFNNLSINSGPVQFEEQVSDIKNLIYTNIYNNLEAIYKSKGTEKSIRNFLRCFGIDDEIVKLNVYTDGGEHYFDDTFKATSFKKKYINFHEKDYLSSTVHQTSSANNPLTYIYGPGTGSSTLNNFAFTLEADVYVPYKKQQAETGYYNTSFLSSSVYGFHQALTSSNSDLTWVSNEIANLQVYLVRDSLNSRRAKWVLENSDGSISVSTDFVEDIYNNNRWNIALRIKPQTYPYAGNVTNASPDYTLNFYAVNHNISTVQYEFDIDTTISFNSGSSYINDAKRVYAGAHLQNFTGSVLNQSDIQIGSIRGWLDYVSNDSIKNHNLDPSNYGQSRSYRPSSAFLDDQIITTKELSILNWDFSTIRGSDSSGNFVVEDLSSGSTDVLYSTDIDSTIRRENRGLGLGFGANSTSFIENEFLYAQKKELPEISYTNDNVFIKGDYEKFFVVDDEVGDNFYLLEKSMNQVVSEEMLKMFSKTQEMANLIGHPVDKYRLNYKKLDKVRELFFDNVNNTPSLENFMNYYKWIDESISKMVMQLIPASVNFGPSIIDVVESHILERNKLPRRIGLLDTVESTEGILKGSAELHYNWRTGHAPPESFTSLNSKYLKIAPNNTGGQVICLDTGVGYSPALGTSNTDYCFYGWFQVPDTVTANWKFFILKYLGSNVINIDIEPSNDRIKVVLYDTSNKFKVWYFPTGIDISSEWFHLIVMNDRSALSGDGAIKVWINGQAKTATSIAPGSGWGSATIRTAERFAVKSDRSSGDYFAIDEVGFIRGAVTNAKALELYNNGQFLDILDYSDIAKVWLHYRFGDLPGDSVSGGGGSYGFNSVVNDTGGAPNYDLAIWNSAAKGILTLEDHLLSNPIAGAGYISEGNDNCLWRRERQIRTYTDDVEIPDRERLRQTIINDGVDDLLVNKTKIRSKLDRTTYDASTYAIRRLSRPFRLDASFGTKIHGGINYNQQKDREFYKTNISVHGPIAASGAPRNIIGIGIGEGDGITEKQVCDDPVNPNDKSYYDATVQVGRFTADTSGFVPHDDSASYSFKLKSSIYWPFNIKSGSVSGGYADFVATNFRPNTIITNIHSDTIDVSNEIPIQGPFTQAHVGGHQGRHVRLNRFDPSLTTEGGGPTTSNIDDAYSRPEAYRLLIGDNPANTFSPDGAMGIVGPDYGGPYPNITRKWAIYYREERAKRPLNIRNIQSQLGNSTNGNYNYPSVSSVNGNFIYNYEVLSTVGMFQQRLMLRDQPSSNSDGATQSPFGNFYDQLPKTTQPLTFRMRGPRIGEAYPISSSELSIPSIASKNVIVNRFSSPGEQNTMSRGFLDVGSSEMSSYNSLNYRNLSVRGSGSYGSGSLVRIPERFPTLGATIAPRTREGLRTLRARHCGTFGQDSQYSSGVTIDQDLPLYPSYHKEHRNNLRRKVIDNYIVRKDIQSNTENTDIIFRAVDGNDSLVSNSYSTIAAGSPLSVSFIVGAHPIRQAGLQWDEQPTIFQLRDSNSPFSTDGSNFRISVNHLGKLLIFMKTRTKAEKDDASKYYSYIYQTVDGPISSGGTWMHDHDRLYHMVVITWSGLWSQKPMVYVGGELQELQLLGVANNPTQNGTDPVSGFAHPFDEVRLLSGAPPLKSLRGSLENVAVWKRFFDPNDVRNLMSYNMDALRIGDGDELIDYWTLGVPGDPVYGSGNSAILQQGFVYPSDIASNDLIHEASGSFPDLLTVYGTGSYYVYEASEDLDGRTNNMHYNSLLPASDFQYSWIRAYLEQENTGLSNGNAQFQTNLENQKIRGFSNPDGLLRVAGSGTRYSLESSIKFPTISEISCSSNDAPCANETAFIVISWPDVYDPSIKYTHDTRVDGTTKNFTYKSVPSQVTNTGSHLTIQQFNNITVSYINSSGQELNCCSSSYNMQARGISHDGSTLQNKPSYVAEGAGSPTPLPWVTNNTNAGGQQAVEAKGFFSLSGGDAMDYSIRVKVKVNCEGDTLSGSLEVKLTGDSSSAPAFTPHLN